MAVNWQIAKGSRQCNVTGRDLEVGEPYWSALKEEGETFLRLDFSEAGWAETDPANFFSYWRGHVQPPEERRQRRLVIDVEAFHTFFTQLETAEEPHKQVFRYLLALILVRKRALRLDEIEKTPEGEFLLLHDRRAERDLRVTVPPVTETALAEAQETLNQIFECQIDMDTADDD